jgi:hypothetical protein
MLKLSSFEVLKKEDCFFLFKIWVHCKAMRKQKTVSTGWYTIIQSDFEGCADILTCDRTPQKVTIKTMSYTNVNVFREKGAKSFSNKIWEPLNFMKSG